MILCVTDVDSTYIILGYIWFRFWCSITSPVRCALKPTGTSDALISKCIHVSVIFSSEV